MTPSPPILLCHRCGATLTPGRGNFYEVRIEARADPSPPEITDEDLREDLAALMREAINATAGLSETDLMGQVYRRLTLHLCSRCFTRWIENPAGDGD